MDRGIGAAASDAASHRASASICSCDRSSASSSIGRRKARLDALEPTSTPLVAVRVPSPITPELAIAHDGLAWLAAGTRWEHRAAEALQQSAPEGRTLVLASYGAGIRVERDALIVAEGHTHNP
jgi:hypothetical protein